MIKLTNVRWLHTSRLTKEQREELLISENYEGKIALETWNINNERIENKAIPVCNVVDYMLGLGEFANSENFLKSKKNGEKNE